MWFRHLHLKPNTQPKLSEEAKKARVKAVEAKETAHEQKKISQRLWDELLEIRKRNNIAAAIRGIK